MEQQPEPLDPEAALTNRIIDIAKPKTVETKKEHQASSGKYKSVEFYARRTKPAIPTKYSERTIRLHAHPRNNANPDGGITLWTQKKISLYTNRLIIKFGV
jgi:hypothetical protein